MLTWPVWVVLSVLLFIGEILTPGFLLACFAIGALGAGFASSLGATDEVEIVVFLIASILVYFTLRPFALRYLYRADQERETNVASLNGKKGLVTEAIDEMGKCGRVDIEGEDWRAVSDRELAIPGGARVEVVGTSGNRLVVKRLPESRRSEDA